MAFVKHQMRSLIDVDPDRARREILAAVRKAKMHMGEAAKALECRQQTLLSWVRALDLEQEIDEMRETAKRNGWHHDRLGGPSFHRDPDAAIAKRSEIWASKRRTREQIAEQLGIPKPRGRRRASSDKLAALAAATSEG